MRQYALARLADMDTSVTFDDFKNHHLNKGTLGLDWVRGWYTWVGNCQKGFAYARARKHEVRTAGRKVSPFEVYGKPDGSGAVHGGVVAVSEGVDRQPDEKPKAARTGGG